MTIALVFWLIFKSILLVLAAALSAMLAFSSAVGGMIAFDEKAPRWLGPGLLIFALLNITGCVAAMGYLARIVLLA